MAPPPEWRIRRKSACWERERFSVEGKGCLLQSGEGEILRGAFLGESRASACAVASSESLTCGSQDRAHGNPCEFMLYVSLNSMI